MAVWQKAMVLVASVYAATKTWPREELYGLTSQARRAAVSIPSNIAEGHGRRGARAFAHHVSIAFGSLRELETRLLIARSLEYLADDSLQALLPQVAEVRRLTLGLLASLDRRISAGGTSSPSSP